MIELQILNYVLKNKSTKILSENNITEDYFNQYSDEYKYIIEHLQEYGNVPDTETFLDKFPDFDIINVSESTEYIVNTIREEHLYSKAVPILTKMSELLQTDSYNAVDYLKSVIPDLKIENRSRGIDIIKQADSRLQEWQETRNNSETRFLPTGFPELDEEIGGLHMGEELLVLFARTGQGKSWVAIKMLEHIWKVIKKPIGILEPEMSANKTGYRFDTVHKNISSKALYRGEEIQGYHKYISRLSNIDVPFIVSHPSDFEKMVTVSKLRQWVEDNHFCVLCVDGISYLQDERKQRGDNKTTQLTNISEDLMQLSIDLKIPVIVVVQSNRSGTEQEDLQLENIRDSDGIAYNASIVLSIQQKETGLQIRSNKVRNGKNNIKLLYKWDTDHGIFENIPQPEKGEQEQEKAEDLRRRYHDKEDESY